MMGIISHNNAERCLHNRGMGVMQTPTLCVREDDTKDQRSWDKYLAGIDLDVSCLHADIAPCSRLRQHFM
jgi:hypothetical protein